MKILLPLTLLIVSPCLSHAEQAYISVGKAKTQKTVLALDTIHARAGSSESAARTISETVKNDLLFMDLFRFIDEKAFLDKSGSITPGSFKMTDWTGISTEFLIKAATAPDPNGLALEGYLYEVGTGKTILAKRYVGSASEPKDLAHSFGNDIVTTLTGLPGIFRTKIAMVCDRTGKKEIYVMDFDGSNVKQITQHRSVALGPAWSPDSTKLVYSVITKNRRNIKNNNLFEYNFVTRELRLLSDKPGINSGAAYHPTNGMIALTMSFLGNPEIFSLNPNTREVTRLTNSMGVDVDPSWSPDGRQLAFVSSRAGTPMIYKMNADGSGAQRLTFAGRYNATPSWSPTNNKMAFAGWLDNVFDIFIMNPDGTNIERLSKNQGNNEDPHFSPDGQFIVFRSNRSGQDNLYVMNVDGTFVKRLTYGLGKCYSPKWSNPMK